MNIKIKQELPVRWGGLSFEFIWVYKEQRGSTEIASASRTWPYLKRRESKITQPGWVYCFC